MHVWTHLKPESQGKTGPRALPRRHGRARRATSGSCCRSSTISGIADNTIVLFTTDNGAEAMSWPDGGTTPFRGEKATNWEGGYRVPMVIRWPGVIEPGTIHQRAFAH